MDEQEQLTSAKELQKDFETVTTEYKKPVVFSLDDYCKVIKTISGWYNIDQDILNDLNSLDSRIKYAVIPNIIGMYSGNIKRYINAIPLTKGNLRNIIQKTGAISAVKEIPFIPAPNTFKVYPFALHRYIFMRLDVKYSNLDYDTLHLED